MVVSSSGDWETSPRTPVFSSCGRGAAVLTLKGGPEPGASVFLQD